jgi:hypothetical protein
LIHRKLGHYRRKATHEGKGRILKLAVATFFVVAAVISFSRAFGDQRIHSDAPRSTSTYVTNKKYILRNDPPTKSLVLLKRLELGDSLKTCRSKIGFSETNSSEIISRFPQISFLPPEATAMWVFEEDSPVSSKIYLFARFEDSRMKKVVDVIELNRGAKFPLVSGLYQQGLQSIKAGANVQELFDVCGAVTGSYFRATNGVWKVRLNYVGRGHDIFIFEADAGTGRIDKAYVSSM